MQKGSGFTVIELLFVVLILAIISVVFFVQRDNIQVAARDEKRKTSINAMYYSLEEVFYKQNKYYPRVLTSNLLPSVDKALFTDPNGVELGQTIDEIDDEEVPVESDYRYEAVECDGDECQGYTLRATLENEDDYIKTSRF